MLTPSWMRRSAAAMRQRLRIGVGDDEFDALQVGADHVVDGVAAGAADTDHGDPGMERRVGRNVS